MADLLAAEALVQVADAAGLEQAIVSLLEHPDARAQLGERAAAAVQRRRGVVDRCAERILHEMEKHGEG